MAQVSFADLVDGVIHTAEHHNTRFNALKSRINAIQSDNLEDSSVTGPKIAMGSDAQGDTLFRGVSVYQRLPAGTSGQFLKTLGSGANPVWASGSVVQQVQTTLTDAATVASGSIPADNTIPTWAEGTAIPGLDTAITPKDSNNILIVEFLFWTQSTGIGGSYVTVFQDPTGTDGAKAAFCEYQSASQTGLLWNASYRQTAGTTSATTFKLRYGGSEIQINGNGSARLFGTASYSYMRITEIIA